ncbi:MAG: hypothetical protein AAGA37_10050 [Actinomycetota bacterium]
MPVARQERLSEDEIELLIERYQAGESTRDLAADSPAHRHTIARALGDAGVELRHKRRRLTDEVVRRAATDYRAGATLATLASTYGVGRETIRRELHNAGVTMRPRGGRT